MEELIQKYKDLIDDSELFVQFENKFINNCYPIKLILSFIILTLLITILGLLVPFGIVILTYDYIRNLINSNYKTKRIKKGVKDYEEKLLFLHESYRLGKYNDTNNWEEVKFWENKDKITLEKFIRTFFMKLNCDYYTFDNENIVICDTSRRRSLGDIFLICRHYYPDCTIEDVLTILIRMLKKVEIGASYCTTIKKYVFHNHSYTWKINDKVEYVSNIKFSDIVKIYE